MGVVPSCELVSLGAPDGFTGRQGDMEDAEIRDVLQYVITLCIGPGSHLHEPATLLRRLAPSSDRKVTEPQRVLLPLRTPTSRVSGALLRDGVDLDARALRER